MAKSHRRRIQTSGKSSLSSIIILIKTDNELNVIYYIKRVAYHNKMLFYSFEAGGVAPKENQIPTAPLCQYHSAKSSPAMPKCHLFTNAISNQVSKKGLLFVWYYACAMKRNEYSALPSKYTLTYKVNSRK